MINLEKESQGLDSSLEQFYNKIESSICYGKMLFSKHSVQTLQYDSVGKLIKKEEFDEKEYVELFSKFMEYRIKLTNVFAAFDG